MPLVLPDWFQPWTQARASAESALVLLTIFHDQMETYRFVRDRKNIISRGQTFTRAPFDVGILNDDGEIPRARLRFPNVDRIIGITLRQIVGPPYVTIELINATYPDEPFYRAARMKLRNPLIDDLNINADLVRGDDGTELCGTIKMTQTRAPALFRRNS